MFCKGRFTFGEKRVRVSLEWVIEESVDFREIGSKEENRRISRINNEC